MTEDEKRFIIKLTQILQKPLEEKINIIDDKEITSNTDRVLKCFNLIGLNENIKNSFEKYNFQNKVTAETDEATWKRMVENAKKENIQFEKLK